MAASISSSASHITIEPPKNAGVEVTTAPTPSPADKNENGSSTYRADFLSTFTPEEEKKIMRKVDYHILMLFGLIYMVKQIDVNNASAVKVMAVGKPTNILKQLHMTADQYNWVQSIYYISYIIFELPSNLLLKRMTPRVFQTRICFGWGAILACHAAVTNRQGLYAVRFFLGVAEAGLFPALMTHLCSWYRGDEMGKPIMWLFGIFNLAGVLGSLLVYGISYLDGKHGLSSWQWTFIIEGVLTMGFAGVVYCLYPDYPRSERTSKWLTPREQEFVELRLTENAPLTSDKAFSAKESIETLKDPRLWAFMFTQVCMNTGGFGLSWFLPTIITNLGFVGLPRNLLLIIPTAAGAIFAIIFAAYILKKAWIPRPLFTLSIIFLETGCFAIFLGTRARGGIYAACVLGTMFSAAEAIPFWAWRTSSLKGTTGTAFAFGLQSGIGQLGGVIGPQIFRQKYKADGYKVSYGICLAAIAAGFFGGCWCWYITRNLETDVRRVRKNRIRAAKEGELYVKDDVKAFEEREFYKRGVRGAEGRDADLVAEV
ncbi:retrograde regulation protein 2 [Mytilinidion resinicola]|uniref:Retrograde regulation protein 2 n=1 Tax=Mytilinidion resinicola TaxID=574789 RepID=A0A6A6Y124_9PEZI|nr:retrograde regulation protein 2 [Mytilinidion resinicola]KAF2802258.1 retrograde regulation protein 2 [Mytilinidion resinicola]